MSAFKTFTFFVFCAVLVVAFALVPAVMLASVVMNALVRRPPPQHEDVGSEYEGQELSLLGYEADEESEGEEE